MATQQLPLPGHSLVDAMDGYVVVTHRSENGTVSARAYLPEHARLLAEDLIQVADEIEAKTTDKKRGK
ncbi:hypothetical protein [Nitrospirillum bahiense]|uniref:Uncharacterized protein n=1 Tax=Nitrospirillum amazonense TaxID=28077 RepID=A0A560F1Y9_9PROT|nr:hypothetical protein [Nitrospirillum amazonense]TWB15624.1 hypothetical protein FBZ88_12977 [Nitrospirillum amazonense]